MKDLAIQCLPILLIFQCALWGDWNADFDQQTNELIQELPQFQDPSYFSMRNRFIQTREKLFTHSLLSIKDKISASTEEDKFLKIIEDLDLILKKRKANNINDLFAWELAFLLGSADYVVPAFPVEMGGKKIIVQHLEPFIYGVESHKNPKRGHLKKVTKTVSLEAYWKAHLHAYILGQTNLLARNVGVNKTGLIRFFDNEDCLIYNNTVVNIENSVKMGYICQSFDWPQFCAPLDKQTAKKIVAFIQNLSDFEHKMRIYANCRQIKFSERGLRLRLEKTRDFSVKAGVSFRDFFGSLHPRLDPGLEQLRHIVQGIFKTEVGYGTTLFFMQRWIRSHPLSSEEIEQIQAWIATYVE